MAAIRIDRLFGPLALIALAGCIPASREPSRAATLPPRPAAQRPAPAPQPQPAAPAPAATTATPPPPTWTARPVTPDAVTIPTSRYVVVTGDTLGRIAIKTRASAEAIARANGLAPPFTVKLGQKLTIPGGRYHLVKRGESGIAIARAYGVDWSQVVTTNHMEEPYILREGQRLLLPSQAEAARMSIEQRAEAFRLDIDDIVTGGEPALASNARPATPTTSPARTLPPTAAVAPPAGRFTGFFRWPVEGKVIRPFGDLGNGRRNDGINIAAPRGTPILAAADGVVAYVGTEVAIYGGLVLIRHADGWITAYGHAENLLVKRGQAVKKGQQIASVAEAGLDEQDQLHFQTRQGRTPVDPVPRLSKS